MVQYTASSVDGGSTKRLKRKMASLAKRQPKPSWTQAADVPQGCAHARMASLTAALIFAAHAPSLRCKRWS